MIGKRGGKPGGDGIETGPRGSGIPGCAPGLAKVKRISGPDWTFGLSPDTPRTSGATVDTGLGPTDGLNAVFKKSDDAKRRSPRRVQTGAYHRPSMLN